MLRPEEIQIVGAEVAIRWSDGRETFHPADRLRAASPSAETHGERDIFGQRHGGHGPRNFSGVTVVGWELIGNYALRFDFSDGHHTGLYAFDYLLQLAHEQD